MHTLRFIILFLTALLSISSYSQPDEPALRNCASWKLLWLARHHTDKAEYLEARKYYLALAAKDSTNPKYNFELGLNYFYHAGDKKAEALPYFERTARYSKDTTPELHYLLAETYHHTGRYDDAVVEYNKFKPHVKPGEAGDELMQEINTKIAQAYHGKAFNVARNKVLRIENLGSNVNSRYADYVPVISRDEKVLMFTSRRNSNTGGKLDWQDDKFYEDMFISRNETGEFGPAEQFRVSDMYVGLIENSPQHDAVVSFSADETKLFTYRDNNLYFSELKSDGVWNGPVPLDETINIKKGYQPHASLSTDGQTLYFSSERKEGAGGLDLYKAVKQADGTWSPAENLGAPINTKEDQDAPYLTEDGKTIYFSSRGHNSMGGYDIFKSEFIDGKWSEPVNLGAPINSPADDIFYNPAKGNRQAYFSSSRKDGLGDMDIYRVTYRNKPSFKECESVAIRATASGLHIEFMAPDTVQAGVPVKLDASSARMPDLNVQNFYWSFDNFTLDSGKTVSHTFPLTGVHEIKMEAIATDNSGEYYNYCVKKPIHVLSPSEISAMAKKEDAGASNDTALAATADTIIPDNALLDIYFDRNSYSLNEPAKATLDRNIQSLKNNPTAIIKLSGHSDAPGTNRFNIQISKKRANAVLDYLVKNGIERRRITGVIARGEEAPVNSCTDNAECTEEQHALNRRVEFIASGLR